MIVYDFEVFAHDWMMCATDGTERYEFHNDFDGIVKFYERFADDIWVGYNSSNYDCHILKAVLYGINPKGINDAIIGKRHYPRGGNVPKKHYDAFVRSADAEFRGIGLKKLEGMMGLDIQECPIPFDIDRPLTPEEVREVIRYCHQDVYATTQVLQHNASYFQTSLYLVNNYNLPMSYLHRTHAQIVAKVLDAKAIPAHEWREFDLRISDVINLPKEYREIPEFFLREDTVHKRLRTSFDVAGVPHRYGWGGVHAALERYHMEADKLYGIGFLDVKQYYPTIMLEHDMLSRAVDPVSYRVFYNKRKEYQKLKEKQLADTYKIIINGVYGQSRQKDSPIYDPYNFNNTVVNGQLFITDLVAHLEDTLYDFSLIQSNTDGIIFLYRKDDDIVTAMDKWAERCKFDYTFDEVRSIWQKDVNNYLVHFEDGGHAGKGDLFKQRHPLANEYKVVHDACIRYLIDGIPCAETIEANHNLYDFQRIISLPKNHESFAYTEGMVTEKLDTKSQRIFYAKEGGDLYGVSSIDETTSLWGTRTYTRRGKIPFATPPLRIVNEDVREMKRPNWVSTKRYVDMAESSLREYGAI